MPTKQRCSTRSLTIHRYRERHRFGGKRSGRWPERVAVGSAIVYRIASVELILERYVTANVGCSVDSNLVFKGNSVTDDGVSPDIDLVTEI